MTQTGEQTARALHLIGLGPCAVLGFARALSGDIKIASAPGRGTTVELRLPLVTSVAAPAPEAARPLQAASALSRAEGGGVV